jgi:hypothetical protein
MGFLYGTAADDPIKDHPQAYTMQEPSIFSDTAQAPRV